MPVPNAAVVGSECNGEDVENVACEFVDDVE